MQDDRTAELVLLDSQSKAVSESVYSGDPWQILEEPSSGQDPAASGDGGMMRDLHFGCSPRDAGVSTLVRCGTRQNLTGASLAQVRRSLARAWRHMLALETTAALAAVDEIELQLDDIPSPEAENVRAATQLLRAAGLTLRDDGLGALAIAVKHVRKDGANANSYVAATLCRLGFRQIGQFDVFYSLPRHEPRLRMSQSRAISAVLDMYVEAAVALEHLNLSAAKRLARDALSLARRASVAAGIETLPATLLALVLYEEGCLDEADTILRDRLQTINAQGPLESALRAYLVLARIARHRMQRDLAAIMLREGLALGERRGWPRLVAACIAERASLLLEAERPKEARRSVEYLERSLEGPGNGRGLGTSDPSRYAVLARARLSQAEAPSRDAVAAIRKLYHDALERRDPYRGCRLAIELAGMLVATGETTEAAILFASALRVGAGAGLCQGFLEGGPVTHQLLSQAYEQAGHLGSTERELLPFLGSLLARWDSNPSAKSTSRAESAMSDILTDRERDILAKIGHGLPNKRIARTLEISPETVKSHVKRIFLKLAVGTRAEAVSQAKSLGLL
jgi:ATP/maltotriose-dependent transcriptional regulator MalT